MPGGTGISLMALSDITPATGTLLIAPPMMQDPNFRRSVVLLCEHGVDGSFGLILNRAISTQLADVVEGMNLYEGPLCMGGPVQPNTLHVLHRLGSRVGESIEVIDEVFWGGDFEIIQQLVENEKTSAGEIRFFLGYAGWSPGQLDMEIEQDGWILAPPDESFIFPEDPEALWTTILRKMGGEYALLANFPDDPRLN